MRDRFEVHIEEPAETVLLSMSENDAAWLYSAIKDFECDPWVHSERASETSSCAVGFLAGRGYDIRRLKVKDVLTWRVFYYVDRMRFWVVVKEIVPRDDDTYDNHAAPHIKRIVANFRRHFFGERDH